MIRGVDAAEVEWDRIEPFLKNFADRSHGFWTVRSLWDAIEAERKQVYVVDDYRAVILTSVGDEYIRIEAAAGSDRESWQAELDDLMADWARASGRSRIFCLARPGWARFAKLRGYREIHREFVREI